MGRGVPSLVDGGSGELRELPQPGPGPKTDFGVF